MEGGAVVTTKAVADADHHAALVAHRLVTSSRRKWVAQEMQGS